LKDVLDAGEADIALISVPQETRGAKFEPAIAEMGQRLLTLRLDAQSATELVENTNAHKLSEAQQELFGQYLSQIFG
jgi:hypothetical protein